MYRSALLIALLASSTAQAATWSDFLEAFPSFPCPDGWMACGTDSDRIDPNLQTDSGGMPTMSTLRVGWFDLEPTAALSPFMELTPYRPKVAVISKPKTTVKAVEPKPVAVAYVDKDAEEKRAREAEQKAQLAEQQRALKEEQRRAEEAKRMAEQARLDEQRRKEEAAAAAKALAEAKEDTERERLAEVARQKEAERKAAEEARRKAEEEERQRKAREEEERRKAEAARKEAERLERERQEAEAREAAERARREQEAREKAEAERREQERLAAEEAKRKAAVAAAEAERLKAQADQDAAMKAQADAAAAAAAAAEQEAAAQAAAEIARAEEENQSCDNPVALEPFAMLGNLSQAHISCLEKRLKTSGMRQTEKEKISLVLINNAWIADKASWEILVSRHLTQINQSDPNLCYKYAKYLKSKGVSRAYDIIRWSETALENKSVWTGATHTERVYKLHELKAVAANSLWQRDSERHATNPGEGTKDKVEKSRNMTKTYARTWYEYAKVAGKETSKALQLCTSAAGTREYCEAG